MKAILVIDDEQDFAENMAAFFESEGYVALTATCGVTALEALEKSKPDLIILDVMMPRMSGVELVQQIKSDPSLKSVPILLMSASKEPEVDLKQKWESFLRKPFDLDELMLKVTALMGR